ncbi:hypothetical protein ABES21_21335 [Peribacillus frigoritolerans]|uniref:hypothetical protein n=1 Tax=Peribacillus frigoritolerans TaxID=450367 RepID=UPI003D2BB0A4
MDWIDPYKQTLRNGVVFNRVDISDEIEEYINELKEKGLDVYTTFDCIVFPDCKIVYVVNNNTLKFSKHKNTSGFIHENNQDASNIIVHLIDGKFKVHNPETKIELGTFIYFQEAINAVFRYLIRQN